MGLPKLSTKKPFSQSHLCAVLKNPCLFMMGGDFNIIQGPTKKDDDNFNDRWPFLFDAIIDTF